MLCYLLWLFVELFLQLTTTAFHLYIPGTIPSPMALQDVLVEEPKDPKDDDNASHENEPGDPEDGLGVHNEAGAEVVAEDQAGGGGQENLMDPTCPFAERDGWPYIYAVRVPPIKSVPPVPCTKCKTRLSKEEASKKGYCLHHRNFAE